MDFIKHVFRYFESSKDQDQAKEVSTDPSFKTQPTSARNPTIAPLYSINGDFVGYVQVPIADELQRSSTFISHRNKSPHSSINRGRRPSLSSKPQAKTKILVSESESELPAPASARSKRKIIMSETESEGAPDRLKKKVMFSESDSEGPRVRQRKTAVEDLQNRPRNKGSVPAPPVHAPKVAHRAVKAQAATDARSQTQASKTAKFAAPHLPEKSNAWDGWPDGFFEQDFTYNEFLDLENLKTHWSYKVCSGYRGDDEALNWKEGKRSDRKCQGVLVCDNEDCQVITRAQTTTTGRAKQLRSSCRCGGDLSHEECPVRSSLYTWSGGVHYVNGGIHEHRRPSHILHLLPNERAEFNALVAANPKLGPLGLVAGVPGIGGPGNSAADISDVLLNAHRVSKEKQKVKKTNVQGGLGAFEAFVQFCKDHPGFVIYSQLSLVTVISLQSPFMASLLLPDDDKAPRSVDGIVSDATYGWWASEHALLLISSVYSVALSCWAPTVFSYINGATAEHYKYHFLALMQSVAHVYMTADLVLMDAAFAMVMDFSDAERAGFILAFVEFWQLRIEDTRSEEELRRAAEDVLKGCEQHFRSGITRVKKIGSVVPPNEAAHFESRALALLDAPDHQEFLLRAKALLQKFPKLEPWLSWWMRESHSSMLFKSERRMDTGLWDAIPNSTNAEEAMHWKLYAAFGRNHELMEGFKCLAKVAEYYERLSEGVNRGVWIRYGNPEPWKAIASQIGRTKRSRAPGEREKKNKNGNDGRPPDTIQQLAGKSGAARKPAASKSSQLVTFDKQSFIWRDNSCWLDTSMELFYQAVMTVWDDLARSQSESMYPKLKEGAPESALRVLFRIVSSRQAADLAGMPLDGETLTRDREELRKVLVKTRLVKEMTSMDSLWVWLSGSCRLIDSDSVYQGLAFYEILYTRMQSCSGSAATGGRPHRQVTYKPDRRYSLVLPRDPDVFNRFKGQVKLWFSSHVQPNRAEEFYGETCWQAHEGVYLCSGTRRDRGGLLISLPLILIIEVNDENYMPGQAQIWDWPSPLLPGTQSEANDENLQYDLVGFGLFKPKSVHYNALYTCFDRSGIYLYNGMVNDGCSQRLKPHGSLAGKEAYELLPPGYQINSGIYALRGGQMAQEYFFRKQTAAATRLYHLKFSSNSLYYYPLVTLDLNLEPSWERVDDSKRTWMKNPYSSKTIDYIRKADSDADPSEKVPMVPGADSEDSELRPQDEHDVAHIKSNVNIDTKSESVNSVSPTLDANMQVQVEEDIPQLSLSQRSDFAFNCRCGTQGDGNNLVVEDPSLDGLDAIMCDDCQEWSHIACQANGRASGLGSGKDKFHCDTCLKSGPGFRVGPQSRPKTVRYSARKEERLAKLTVSERLTAGKGALALNHKYHYPVRLLQRFENKKWKVKWWRGCEFGRYPAPDPAALVDESRLVDELWLNSAARRQIRLGNWLHGEDAQTDEDIIVSWWLASYSKELDDILRPHLPLLRSLLNDCRKVRDIPSIPDAYRRVPAFQHLWGELHNNSGPIPPNLKPEEEKLLRIGRSMARTAADSGRFATFGDLTPTRRAQISHWIDDNIPGAKLTRKDWVESLPVAHAATIVIASDKRANLELSNSDTDTNLELLWRAAWDYQCSAIHVPVPDIDCECLKAFERRLFEYSEEAGPAGNQQWGLDIGEPQAHVNHYSADYSRGKGEGSDAEVICGPDFSQGSGDEKPSGAVKPRPTPKPKRKAVDQQMEEDGEKTGHSLHKRPRKTAPKFKTVSDAQTAEHGEKDLPPTKPKQRKRTATYGGRSRRKAARQ